MENKCNNCFYALMDRDTEAPCITCTGYSNFVKGDLYMTAPQDKPYNSKPLTESIDEWFGKTNGMSAEGFLYAPSLYDTVNKPTPPEYTGGSVGYYRVKISSPTAPDLPSYTAECNDIIEALGMDFAEGNVFKAVWRRCAARNKHLTKKGYTDGVYDAEKIVFFGERLVQLSKTVEANV